MLQDTLRAKKKSKLYPQALLTFCSCLTKPAFKALLAIHPDFNLLSLDIVSYRSTLSNLLRFYRGLDKDFRFNVDLVRDTIFLICKESLLIALLSDIRGYKHTFPKAYTIWELEVKGLASY